MLYINEQYVGRGIYRCNKHNWYYDEYDVGKFLRPGKNVICIIAQFIGETLSWLEPFPHGGISGRTTGKGGLIFQLDIPGKSPITISSDKTTRAFPCSAWQQDAPLVNVGLAFVEIFDAAKMPPGWMETGFDDSGNAWGHSMEIAINNIMPNMVKCDIPRLAESKIRAAAITSAGILQEYFTNDDIKESFNDPASDPIDFHVQLAMSTYKDAIKGLDENWQAGKPIEIGLGADPVGIVFDMGRDVSGHVFFEIISENDGIIIDIAWSEKLDIAKGMKMPRASAFQEKQGSRYICKAGENQHELFHWYGFRYVQANIKGKGKVTIRNFGANLFLYPVKEVGSFSCNDEKLTKLYEACAWTLRNCMHDGYEDCPSREQRQWIGDAYVEILTNYAVFGDTALARKLIVQCAQSQRGDGLTDMCTPGDAEIHGLIIPDYCLYWISEIYQYYWYTGDTSIVVEMLPSMLRAIKWFIQYIDPATGLLTDMPYWTFIDWSANDKWGACCPINAQLYNAMKQLAEMGRLAGWDKAVAHLDGIANNIAKGINTYLWDEKRGAYADAVVVCQGGKVEKRSHKVTFHANALAVLYDIAPPDRVASIVKNVFDKPYPELYVQNQVPIWQGITAPKLDEDKHVVMAEPYFFHHVNQALAKLGRHDLIARFMHDGWCKMLDHGATTIWESWGDFGSLCHAWSATPAHDLARHCLGVQITSPGAERVKIAPHPMGLARAKGTVPTIKGQIEVEWQHDAKQRLFKVDVKAPSGVKVTVESPTIDGVNPSKVSENKVDAKGTLHVEAFY